MKEPITAMKRPLPPWESTMDDTRGLRSWRESAFTAAMEKFNASHGNVETILQTGEAFGRAIFSSYLAGSEDWILEQWCTEVSQLLAPLGDAFALTGGQHDVVATFLRRRPLASHRQDRPLDSLFTYGTLRGLFISAFPDGELVVKPEPMGEDTPGSLMFKLHPSSIDRLARERVKDTYSVMNRHDTP